MLNTKRSARTALSSSRALLPWVLNSLWLIAHSAKVCRITQLPNHRLRGYGGCSSTVSVHFVALPLVTSKVHTCTYTYTHRYTHIHTYTYPYTHTHTHIHTDINILIHTCTHRMRSSRTEPYPFQLTNDPSQDLVSRPIWS